MLLEKSEKTEIITYLQYTTGINKFFFTVYDMGNPWACQHKLSYNEQANVMAD